MDGQRGRSTWMDVQYFSFCPLQRWIGRFTFSFWTLWSVNFDLSVHLSLLRPRRRPSLLLTVCGNVAVNIWFQTTLELLNSWMGGWTSSDSSTPSKTGAGFVFFFLLRGWRRDARGETNRWNKLIRTNISEGGGSRRGRGEGGVDTVLSTKSD